MTDHPGSQNHDTYRTECGRGRVTYREDWSPSQPWVSYWQGTAGRHFATLDEARRYFQVTHKVKLVC